MPALWASIKIYISRAIITSGWAAYSTSVRLVPVSASIACHAVADDALFEAGYMGFEYISSRLLQRLPLAKFSAFNIIIWGAVLACFSTVSNFGGAAAIRVFLGVFESAVTPGFALLTSQVRLPQTVWKRLLTM